MMAAASHRRGADQSTTRYRWDVVIAATLPCDGQWTREDPTPRDQCGGEEFVKAGRKRAGHHRLAVRATRSSLILALCRGAGMAPLSRDRHTGAARICSCRATLGIPA